MLRTHLPLIKTRGGNVAPLIVRGAGLRWRPLHESAEAPTEPGGETVGAKHSEGIKGIKGIKKTKSHTLYCNKNYTNMYILHIVGV